VKTEIKAKTLGDWAALAIKKHFEKVLKHEDNVLADRDPEALHQMRVGMRRLRSTMTGFAPALDLPKSAQENKIGKIGRQLGTLRDLDVLREALQKKYQPALPQKEQKQLDVALKHLDKQRSKALALVKETLQGDRYSSLKLSLKKWLKQPQFHAIASVPIQEVLPDLLLPQVSKLLLHPGWLVGTEIKKGKIEITRSLKPEIVKQKLAEQGEMLHSLRKETKRIRYQMEVFKNFYGTAYEAYLTDMTSIQEVLGQLHDSVVLSEFMIDVLQSDVKDSLPTLVDSLTKNDYQAWQHWQTLQQRYAILEIRKDFHKAILQPAWGNNSNGNNREPESTPSQENGAEG
jgi:CHAD domain-containing protein